MKVIYLIMICLCCFVQQLKAEEKIPKDEKWENGDNRNNTSPELYQNETYVYIYSEKQLDNLYIGITDMQGNIYYEEIATVSSGIYYPISIELLPQGMYYISIIQGSDYVVGIFSKS